MLDIIEDWAVDYKNLNVYRIDGSTPQDMRRQQMKEFNEGGDKEGASNLFLLSTRAGGLVSAPDDSCLLCKRALTALVAGLPPGHQPRPCGHGHLFRL